MRPFYPEPCREGIIVSMSELRVGGLLIIELVKWGSRTLNLGLLIPKSVFFAISRFFPCTNDLQIILELT